MLSWRKDSGAKGDADKFAASSAAPSPSGSKPAAAAPSRASNPQSASDLTADGGELEHPRHQLGSILVQEGVITQAQLDEALAKKEREGGFLGQMLVDLKFIHRETLISFLVKQCKIPHLSLLDYQFNEELFKYISKETCLKHNLLPIDRLGKILTVAMVDPLDSDALEAVRTACPELKIKPILCDWYHYETVARRVLEKHVDRGEETASSFGLTERPKTQAPKPAESAAGKAPAVERPAVAPAPSSRPQEPGRTAAPAAPSAPSESHVSSDDIAAAARESAREAVNEAMTVMVDAVRSAMPAQAASSGPSAEMLAAAVGESVREAMHEMIGLLDERIQSSAPAAAAGLSAEELAAAMKSAIQEASASIGGVRSNASGGAAHAGPSVEDLAAAVGESVRAAMHDVVSLMDERIHKASATPVSRSAEAEIAALEQAREALATQEARLHEVVNAASQAAKSVETAALESAQQRGKLEDERRRKHATVTPLNKAERDALAALESPVAYAPEDDRMHAALASEQPLEGYTFEGYIVSKANSFTVAMGKAVAEKPGSEYNPFFLYGDVGIGKTHLINAIGNHILNVEPNRRVGYVSSSRFASALGDAIQEHALGAFRENYCHWDVLILDDIQFMGGRVEAQEEFFHIFNALHQEGRQIIIAGDKPPDQLGQLEKRLVSRFAGGIVASLRPPEWETRMAILRRQAKDSKVKVPEEVLSLIATRVPNDIRKMSGSLRKVAAFASLVGQEVTCDMATEILSHLGLSEVA